MSTNALEVLTGVEGEYRDGGWFVPKGFGGEHNHNWTQVAGAKHLVAEQDNLVVVDETGHFVDTSYMLSIALDSAASAASDTIEGQEDEEGGAAAGGATRARADALATAEEDTTSESGAAQNPFNVSELVVQMADLDSAQTSVKLQGGSANTVDDIHHSE